MPTIIEEYVASHHASLKLHQESSRVFPGGVTHDTRRLAPFPVYMTRSKGPRKWDVDDNEYIDYVMGHGALILGHAHPQIAAGVQEQVTRGTHLGANTQLELSWAAAVRKLIPSIQKLRFHSSGTEAVMMALRLARAFTGRSHIIKFTNHFHGWYDDVLPHSFHGTTQGVPARSLQNTIVLEPGNPDAVRQVVRESGDIAAVILEPTGGRMGAFALDPAFVRGLREITHELDVPLIFDEVVTGFRVSPGGAQAVMDVVPDLTVLAKILGGGLPGGAVGGRQEILDLLGFRDDEEWNATSRVSHPGTYNANPLSAAAGSRCLDLIASQPINEQANRAAGRLRDGLNRALTQGGVQGVAYGTSSLIRVLFGIEPDGDRWVDEPWTLPHREVETALHSRAAALFRQAMLNNGVDPMSGCLFIVSAVHSDGDIDATVEAFDRSLRSLRAEGLP